ncbi:GNAT family N-acetyltransferase [Priestia koreensis]|uniref:GNAT family N-acetyltransferase n=1 Tax=Priestia koreensis TaxID=284581 RepID=UPI003D0386BD
MSIVTINTSEQLKDAFSIRKAVFIDEQHVPEAEEFDEFDQLDGSCDHILVYYDRQPVGTGRVRMIGDVGKLERICILEPYRKFGLGKGIIAALEELAKKRQGTSVKLHGQTQAEGFYHKLGYETVSEPFIEADIPHVCMTKSFI